MQRIAYFDCFSGVSGDMVVAALLDAGLDFAVLKSELSKLNLQNYKIEFQKTVKSQISATKFVVKDKAVLDELEATNQIAAQYAKPNGDLAQGEFPYNPNGSVMDIAGICDSTGRIFGMMPHPEAFLHFTNHPRWTRIKEELKREGKSIPEQGEGLKIFINAVEYVRNNL